MKKILMCLICCSINLVASGLISEAGKKTTSLTGVGEVSCGDCHGSGGHGPSLKGLSAMEMERKLKGYSAGTYGGATKAQMSWTKDKTDAELKKIAKDYKKCPKKK